MQRLNAGWRLHELDALPALFHERAVIVDAAHQRLAMGRAACVESYRAFVTSVTVETYQEGPPTVDRFEGSAVVTGPRQADALPKGSAQRQGMALCSAGCLRLHICSP